MGFSEISLFKKNNTDIVSIFLKLNSLMFFLQKNTLGFKTFIAEKLNRHFSIEHNIKKYENC